MKIRVLAVALAVAALLCFACPALTPATWPPVVPYNPTLVTGTGCPEGYMPLRNVAAKCDFCVDKSLVLQVCPAGHHPTYQPASL